MDIKPDKKVINGWAMYDWANSVYPLVITTAIFPLFYAAITKGQQVEIFGFKPENTALISYTGAVGFLIVSLLSPFLSGIADYVGNKKPFLQCSIWRSLIFLL